MKFFIASDIHGSKYYCEKLLERYRFEKADVLLLLGDILYHGPRNNLPKEYNPTVVAELLNAYNKDIICVQGNCDSDVDKMLLNFDILPQGSFICVDNNIIFATHGHIFNKSNPLSAKANIIIYGHTHVPKCETYSNILYINPGSVSIPKNNSENSYMTFDKNEFIWKTIEGQIFNKYKVR